MINILKKFWWLLLLLFVTLPSLIRNAREVMPEYIRIIQHPKETASIIENFGVKKDINNINCFDLNKWRPDKNIVFEGNKIKLKDGEISGAITLKNNINNEFDIKLIFNSHLKSGINTNIAFKNDSGEEIKYAIGDGDFSSIRYYGTGMQISTSTSLITEIDNSKNIEFKANIFNGETNRIRSSLFYWNKNGEDKIVDLNDLIIPTSQISYFVMGFGLDARSEPENNDTYVEIKTCTITEKFPQVF